MWFLIVLPLYYCIGGGGRGEVSTLKLVHANILSFFIQYNTHETDLFCKEQSEHFIFSLKLNSLDLVVSVTLFCNCSLTTIPFLWVRENALCSNSITFHLLYSAFLLIQPHILFSFLLLQHAEPSAFNDLCTITTKYFFLINVLDDCSIQRAFPSLSPYSYMVWENISNTLTVSLLWDRVSYKNIS